MDFILIIFTSAVVVLLWEIRKDILDIKMRFEHFIEKLERDEKETLERKVNSLRERTKE
jgi:hypothetical protein